MAVPNSFAQIGHKNGTMFVPDALRAQDVWATTGMSVEEHIADTNIHLSSGQQTLLTNAGNANGAATLDPSGKVPTSQLPSASLTASDLSVTDIAALLALSETDAPLDIDVFVNDASGDTTVTAGWALYRRIAVAGDTLNDWIKLAEGEGLDVALVDRIARDNAQSAQGTADNALTAAATAQSTAESAEAAAVTAQNRAELLDFAYCEDESDMNEKNLRDGAFVLMSVTNE
jgi:hypothetical protein